MINILKIIVIKIFSILPDSPFSQFFEDMDTGFFEYLNWFLPLDTCLVMLLAWIDCVLIVFIILLVKKYIVDTIISIVVNVSSVAGLFV